MELETRQRMDESTCKANCMHQAGANAHIFRAHLYRRAEPTRQLLSADYSSTHARALNYGIWQSNKAQMIHVVLSTHASLEAVFNPQNQLQLLH